MSMPVRQCCTELKLNRDGTVVVYICQCISNNYIIIIIYYVSYNICGKQLKYLNTHEIPLHRRVRTCPRLNSYAAPYPNNDSGVLKDYS